MSLPDLPNDGTPDFEAHAVESLSDDELEQELTVVAHDPVRRADRYERLFREWLERQRGYRGGASRTEPTST